MELLSRLVNESALSWSIGSVSFYLFWRSASGYGDPRGGWFNAYATFPERILKSDDESGVLSLVDVHGGITLIEQEGSVMIYGFDTAHAGDERDPRLMDIKWLSDEVVRMAIQLLVAREFEADWDMAREAGDYRLENEIADRFNARTEHLMKYGGTKFLTEGK